MQVGSDYSMTLLLALLMKKGLLNENEVDWVNKPNAVMIHFGARKMEDLTDQDVTDIATAAKTQKFEDFALAVAEKPLPVDPKDIPPIPDNPGTTPSDL